jgi:23S rRNA pseudouridine1911/1915/1917 synthase
MNEMIPASLAGERVDRVIASLTGMARSTVAELIESGSVLVDGKPVKNRGQKVEEAQVLEFEMLTPDEQMPVPQADVAFDVLYQDEHIVVVDKPAGLVVHPGSGNPDKTLVNGLLHRFPDIESNLPGDPKRPGIVHRLDAGTTGLLVVARTQAAYERLVEMMKERDVQRRYIALVWGDMQPDNGVIDAPIGRSEGDRTKMAVSGNGRTARTRYEVLQRNSDPTVCLVGAQLETGRTHQIRVHFAAIKHPVVGDRRYRGVRQGIMLDRPFLHARSLEFQHPITGEKTFFESPLPRDLSGLLNKLEIPQP